MKDFNQKRALAQEANIMSSTKQKVRKTDTTMRDRIINYCENKYKFFGKGILNFFYFHTVVILRRTYLVGV